MPRTGKGTTTVLTNRPLRQPNTNNNRHNRRTLARHDSSDKVYNNKRSSSENLRSVSNSVLLALQLVLIKWFRQSFDTASSGLVENEPFLDVTELLTDQLIGYTISTVFLLNGVILLVDAWYCRGNDRSLQSSTSLGKAWNTLSTAAAVAATFLIPAVARECFESEEVCFWITATILASHGIAEMLYTVCQYAATWFRNNNVTVLSATKGGMPHVSSAATAAFFLQCSRDINFNMSAFVLALSLSSIPAYGGWMAAKHSAYRFPAEVASKVIGLLILPFSRDAFFDLPTLLDEVVTGEALIGEVLARLAQAARRRVIILTLFTMVAARWYGELFVPVVSVGIGGFLALMVLVAGFLMQTKLSNAVAGAILVAQFVLC